MNLKHLTILTMILSSLFSYGQSHKYKIIKKNVLFYEFNTQRDEIYILDRVGNLSVYDINTKELKVIGSNFIVKPYLEKPMTYIKSDILYIIGEDYVYKIENKKLVDEIPNLCNSFDISATNPDYIRKHKQEIDRYNEALFNFDGEKAILIAGDVYILDYKDNTSIAFYQKVLLNDCTEEKNREKIKAIEDVNMCSTDTSYYSDNIDKKNTISYFENKKTVIKEQAYFCKIFRPIMYNGPNPCWYKMEIISSGKNIILKDKIRMQRSMFSGLSKKLPYSNYLSDKNGDIYLLFEFGDEKHFIKIPMNN